MMSKRALSMRVTAVALLATAATAVASQPAFAGASGEPATERSVARASAAAAEDCYVPPNANVGVIKTVYAVGVRRNVSGRVLLAAFEAGWVESRMNNLDCGTYDSVGVFQQRPSQGWCDTPAQCMNVKHASHRFYERAQALEPGCGCSAGELAQMVQVSAYPDRYDQAEGTARQLIDQAASLIRPWPTLRRGMHGPNVRTLQLLLQQRRYYIAADGQFGPATERAVNQFKRRNGLRPDGVVGPNAWDKVVLRLEKGMRGKKVSAAKVQLNKHGAHLDARNHYFGQRMADTVLWFKVDEGLRANRVIVRTTWRYLLGRPGGV